MREPLVYIAIINWNGKQDTDECLTSIEKITYKNFKIILVDNASTDGSIPFLKSKYKKLEIIHNSKNIGFSLANNQVIEKAIRDNADYILFLNNDTTVDRQFLNHLVKFMEDDKDTGAVGGKIYFSSNPHLLWFAGGFINFKDGKIFHDGYGMKDTERYNTSKEIDFITGCLLLTRIDILKKAGGFDKTYFTYVEDVDLCYRIKHLGYKIYYQPKSIIWHKVSATTALKKNKYKEYMITRNTIIFAKKNLKGLIKRKFINNFIAQTLINSLIHLKNRRLQIVLANIKGIFYGIMN